MLNAKTCGKWKWKSYFGETELRSIPCKWNSELSFLKSHEMSEVKTEMTNRNCFFSFRPIVMFWMSLQFSVCHFKTGDVQHFINRVSQHFTFLTKPWKINFLPKESFKKRVFRFRIVFRAFIVKIENNPVNWYPVSDLCLNGFAAALAKSFHNLIKYQSCYRVAHREQRNHQTVTFVSTQKVMFSLFLYHETLFMSLSPLCTLESTSCMKPIMLVLQLLIT